MVGAWSTVDRARVHRVECMGLSGLAPERFLRELGGECDAGLPIRSGTLGGKRFIPRSDIGFLI